MKIAKMYRTIVATTLFILTCSFFVSAQNVIGLVQYIKADDPEEFLEIEKEWHKIYKELIKNNEFNGCSVYQVLYKTKQEDYNFVKIKWFDAFSKISLRIDYDHFKNAYPNRSEADWEDLLEKTDNSFKESSSGIFQMEASCANGLDVEGFFYKINEIKIKPGKRKEYLSIMKDIYMPVFQEDILEKHRTAWSMWAKWTGSTDNFEYTTADGYANLEQIEEDRFNDYFNKIHPDKNIDTISEQMNNIKTLVNSEMWKLIYRILQ